MSDRTAARLVMKPQRVIDRTAEGNGTSNVGAHDAVTIASQKAEEAERCLLNMIAAECCLRESARLAGLTVKPRLIEIANRIRGQVKMLMLVGEGHKEAEGDDA